MFAHPTASRLAAGAVIIAVAAVGTLGAPTPAYAVDRERGESAYDTEAVKTATASCPAGQLAIGAGGRIKDGNGGVALAAVVPAPTSVTVRGEAFAGHRAAWSVIAVAVCRPSGDADPVVVAGKAGAASTASCAQWNHLSGTGFSLPAGSALAGLVPDVENSSVTVRPALVDTRGGLSTAYAICVPDYHSSWDRRYQAVSPAGVAGPKTATAVMESDWAWPQMSGVGGEVGWSAGPAAAGRAGVFIDTLMPSLDLMTVTVQAVQRPAGARAGLLRAAAAKDPAGGESWWVTGYGVEDAYYY